MTIATLGRPFTERPTHKLSHSQAREWVMAELIGEHVLAPVPYETWRLVLTQWQTIRLQAGYLTAGALIGELLEAGARCRDARTRQSIDQVAALWVRCHDEAGVACEEC